jgi:hypothetical protein
MLRIEDASVRVKQYFKDYIRDNSCISERLVKNKLSFPYDSFPVTVPHLDLYFAVESNDWTCVEDIVTKYGHVLRNELTFYFIRLMTSRTCPLGVYQHLLKCGANPNGSSMYPILFSWSSLIMPDGWGRARMTPYANEKLRLVLKYGGSIDAFREYITYIHTDAELGNVDAFHTLCLFLRYGIDLPPSNTYRTPVGGVWDFMKLVKKSYVDAKGTPMSLLNKRTIHIYVLIQNLCTLCILCSAHFRVGSHSTLRRIPIDLLRFCSIFLS